MNSRGLGNSFLQGWLYSLEEKKRQQEMADRERRETARDNRQFGQRLAGDAINRNWQNEDKLADRTYIEGKQNEALTREEQSADAQSNVFKDILKKMIPGFVPPDGRMDEKSFNFMGEMYKLDKKQMYDEKNLATRLTNDLTVEGVSNANDWGLAEQRHKWALEENNKPTSPLVGIMRDKVEAKINQLRSIIGKSNKPLEVVTAFQNDPEFKAAMSYLANNDSDYAALVDLELSGLESRGGQPEMQNLPNEKKGLDKQFSDFNAPKKYYPFDTPFATDKEHMAAIGDIATGLSVGANPYTLGFGGGAKALSGQVFKGSPALAGKATQKALPGAVKGLLNKPGIPKMVTGSTPKALPPATGKTFIPSLRTGGGAPGGVLQRDVTPEMLEQIQKYLMEIGIKTFGY